MQIRDAILKFLLETHAKFSDSQTAHKAKELLVGFNEESGSYVRLTDALPHEGAQSPLPKTVGDGLGDQEPAKSEQPLEHAGQEHEEQANLD